MILFFFPTGLRPHFDFSCQSHTYCKPHNQTLTTSHSLVAHWAQWRCSLSHCYKFYKTWCILMHISRLGLLGSSSSSAFSFLSFELLHSLRSGFLKKAHTIKALLCLASQELPRTLIRQMLFARGDCGIWGKVLVASLLSFHRNRCRRERDGLVIPPEVSILFIRLVCSY